MGSFYRRSAATAIQIANKTAFVCEGRFEFASIVRRLIYGLGGVGDEGITTVARGVFPHTQKGESLL